MKEILKIKTIQINEFWYAWHIDYIDKKIFEENKYKDFEIGNKNFSYYVKKSKNVDFVSWTSAYGYERYIIYLSINNIEKRPAFIRKELVEDFKKAIEWINNNVK